MVAKGRPVAWSELPAPTTLSQAREYLDACKQWLLDVEVDEPIVRRPLAPRIPYRAQRCKNIGLELEHVHPHNTFECFTCKKMGAVGTEGRPVHANPFTKSSIMLVCDACHQDHFLRQ